MAGNLTTANLTVLGVANISGVTTLSSGLVGTTATFSGATTSAGANVSGGPIYLDFSTTNPKFILSNGTGLGSGTYRSGVTFASYQSGFTNNLTQVQNSTSGTGTTAGAVYGLITSDFVLWNLNGSGGQTQLRAGPSTGFQTASLDINGNFTAPVLVGSTGVLVGSATGATTTSNALIGSYNAGSTANYVQLQNSTTGAATGSGVLIGANGNDTRLLNFQSGGDTVIQSNTNNGTVRLRGNGLTVRVDSATDGTYSTNATIGTFRNDSTSNYLQVQSQTSGGSGTGTGAGGLFGIAGTNTTVRSLDSGGQVVLQTTGGTATLDSTGVFNATMALTGSICAQNFYASASGSAPSNLYVATDSAANFITNVGTYTNGITLVGYAISRSAAGSGSTTFRLTVAGTATTGADITFPAANINGSNTLSKTIAGRTNWGYQLQAGSLPSSTLLTLTIYYQIN